LITRTAAVIVAGGAILAALCAEPMVGAVVGSVASYALVAAVILGWRRRRLATRTLSELPFPVHHSRLGPLDETSYASAIEEVRLQLAKPLDGIAAEAACREAMQIAPGLSAMASRGETIVLGAWPWRKHDLDLLATLLSTWGRRLHDQHGIVGVSVMWAKATGPKPAI
jgi:hypothetical protein